jgi:hypothetical protein
MSDEGLRTYLDILLPTLDTSTYDLVVSVWNFVLSSVRCFSAIASPLSVELAFAQKEPS